MKDYYQILGLRKEATNVEIKKAFKLYAVKYHPDKQDGDKFFEEKFKEIKEAYDILIDEVSRANYDKLYKNDKEDLSHLLKVKEQRLNELARELLEKERDIDRKTKVAENNISMKLQNEKKEREAKIYFKKGNVIINGNRITIGDISQDLNKIDRAELLIISKIRYRIIGYFFLFVGAITLLYLIGILFIIVGIIFIFKRDTYLIKLFFEYKFEYLANSQEKKFSKQIVSKINEAINFNKKYYSNY